MSHSHTPGGPTHSHGPAQAAPQMPVPPPPDPAVLAAIEQDYKPVPLKLNENQVLCDGHGLEKCGECEVDFVAVNQLAKMIVSHPEYAVPPPPNMIPPQRSQAVSKAKEEGNVSV